MFDDLFVVEGTDDSSITHDNDTYHKVITLSLYVFMESLLPSWLSYRVSFDLGLKF